MVKEKSWKEFRETKLLWWINRILHTFGWAIVYQIEENGDITNVFPARVKFRGFPEKSEEAGYIGVTEYLVKESKQLLEEVNE